MKNTLEIAAHDGGRFSAHVHCPDTDQPTAAVIVIQEIFGINAFMRDVCAQIAQIGFLAVCPDLFWRQEAGVAIDSKSPDAWKHAMTLYEGFDVDLGVRDLISTLAAVRGHAQCSGHAGTLGYCLGGKLAFLMAARSDADCNVSYYGVGIEKLLGEARNIANPLLMHIAEKDKSVPLEAQHAIMDALKGNDHVQINVYAGAEHAFARPSGDHYDKEAAHLANFRTADFLAVCLGHDDQ
jgi:carboxymethylenebutenolidase